MTKASFFFFFCYILSIFFPNTSSFFAQLLSFLFVSYLRNFLLFYQSSPRLFSPVSRSFLTARCPFTRQLALNANDAIKGPFRPVIAPIWCLDSCFFYNHNVHVMAVSFLFYCTYHSSVVNTDFKCCRIRVPT